MRTFASISFGCTGSSGSDADVDHAHTDVIGRGESIGRGAAGQIGHHHRDRDR